jgi:hypothetical protein
MSEECANVSAVNNNAWGDDGSGYSCMRIADDDKSFTVTYQWTGDASTVKGFPYMKVWPDRLPTQLWNISALEFAAQWRIYVNGTQDQSPEEQAIAYDNTGLRVNAAIDMFLSDNITNSTQVGPPIEIMIWPWHTPDVLPLGHAESTPDIDVVEIDNMNYSLYHGWNAQGQHVFSWLAHQNITSTDADYAPLLKYIVDKGLLSGALYVGQLEFGTEVMHAGEETVFEASNYTLKVVRDSDVPATSSATPSPTASTSRPVGSSPPPTQTADSASTSNAAAGMSPDWGGYGMVTTAGVWLAIALLTTSVLFIDTIT